MNTRWQSQHRRVLAHVVDAYDQGTEAVDRAACAAALRLTTDEVDESLILLRDGGFLEGEETPTGEVLLTRVCPLTRQILGPGSAADEPTTTVILRATSWH